MEATAQQLAQKYLVARHQHPAWLLLAAHRAPLVLSCLQTLFEESRDGVDFDDAQQSLSETLAQYANTLDDDAREQDAVSLARKELKDWIKKGLVIERSNRLFATDALEVALGFVQALDGRIMTSSASRLSVVQREIENLEANLNPDPKSRVRHIQRKIDELKHELAEAEAGKIQVLTEAEAAEGIREVFNLATGLRADFRRVEDSWREADHRLRHSIISDNNHRGTIVDKLLDGHDNLLETPEGRVFHGFQQQLGRSIELDDMKVRIRTILRHPVTPKALTSQQQSDLRFLVMRLVKESATVIQARARIERDVKGFIKSGLAAEHHRVGHLLTEIFHNATEMDWGRSSLRSRPGPLPPIGISLSGLPVVERLRFKSLDQGADPMLELDQQHTDLREIEDDFWQSFDGLDREALLRDTLSALEHSTTPLSLSELVRVLPPTHDLETLSMWLSMAREADLPISTTQEEIDITENGSAVIRFRVPLVHMDAKAFKDIEWEL